MLANQGVGRGDHRGRTDRRQGGQAEKCDDIPQFVEPKGLRSPSLKQPGARAGLQCIRRKARLGGLWNQTRLQVSSAAQPAAVHQGQRSRGLRMRVARKMPAGGQKVIETRGMMARLWLSPPVAT